MVEALQPSEAPLIPTYHCMILHETNCTMQEKVSAVLPREACGDWLSKSGKLPNIQRKVNSRHLGVNVIGYELSNQMWSV